MKVGCVRCNKVFESLVIEPETAWKDIFTELTNHMNQKHPKYNKIVLETAAKGQMAIFSYLVITQTAKAITDGNVWLDTRVDELRDNIMRLIGYEPVEDEEIETEEEEKEDNKEEEETPVFEEAD